MRQSGKKKNKKNKSAKTMNPITSSALIIKYMPAASDGMEHCTEGTGH